VSDLRPLIDTPEIPRALLANVRETLREAANLARGPMDAKAIGHVVGRALACSILLDACVQSSDNLERACDTRQMRREIEA
jgi:hypothetical protein